MAEVICDYSDLPDVMCAHCTGTTEHGWSLKAAERLTHIEPDRRTWRPVSSEMGAGRLYSPAVVPMPSHGSPCQACGKLAGDYFVCPACIEQLECDCANVPALVEQLNITIARLDNVYTPAPPASAEADEPMPFGMAASAASRELKAALVLAALMILRRRGQEWEGEDSAEAVAARLGVSSASVALDPDAGSIVLSIREAVSRALKAIDTMPERILAGPCPDCGTRLMAFKDAAKVWCDVCQERHVVADLKSAMLDKLADQKGSVNAIHEMLRAAGLWVPLGTVKRWSSEGTLPMTGITATGSREHRFGDLQELVNRRKEVAWRQG